MYAQWTDKQLIDQWQATRDERAFSILDGRHRPRLTNYVRGCLDGYFKDFADEIVQDVFNDLQATSQVFHDDLSVKPWLTTVADRRTDDFLRRQFAEKRDAGRTVSFSTLLSGKTKGTIRAEHREGEEFALPLCVPVTPVDDATPDKLACQNEQDEIVRKMVGQLTGKQREVMQKYCLEGHNIASTAEALGLSRSAVKTHLERAKQKLLQMYEFRQLVGESAEEPSPERESTRAAGRSLLQNLPKIILILLAVIGSVADARDRDVYRGACTAENDDDEVSREGSGHHQADKQRRKTPMRLPLRPVTAVAYRPVLDREHPSVLARLSKRRAASTLFPDFGLFRNDREDSGGILSFRTAQSARSLSKVPRSRTLEAG